MTAIGRLLVALGVVLTSTACGGGPGDREVRLTARGARFEPAYVEAAPGETLRFVLDNQDPGVAHNLHIEAGPSGVFRTEPAQGPGVQELKVRVERPGRYMYWCDAHVTTMRGTLVVT